MEHRAPPARGEQERIESPLPGLDDVCSGGRQCLHDGIAVISDVPDRLPVTAEEVGLLRAFLRDEIAAILREED